MTAAQKAQALVDGGLSSDLAEAAADLLDMGEISQAAADKIAAKAAQKEKVALAIRGEKQSYWAERLSAEAVTA